ncbi:MAG: NAD(P)/FAD-dependent oxidoreductase [Sphaerochaetaceae bacterium]|jgi:thioredoxin reductase|nr:NAD(P)/FAD-dependent oxidoreductase [Sphaerochaetaceae bacterium]
MRTRSFDVAVIGSGPAGMAAAISASDEGSSVVIIDREGRSGGVLKQCVHDGFGLERFHKRLSGPWYAQIESDEVSRRPIEVHQDTFASRIEKTPSGFSIFCSSPRGFERIDCAALIMATGCRERTSKQIAIHGTRPAGIFNAGTAQNMVNIHGILPGRKAVILGSGDIGLIMARRLSLEGCQVIGVYEAKSEPSGLARNIHQCLDDYHIPLYLGTTVTRCIGIERLEAVEVAKTDSSMHPIAGTEQIVSCDTLVISVGLIAENELIKPLGVKMDKATSAPVTDQYSMTSINGLFCTGNCRVVFDLVDTVSKTSMICGRRASQIARKASAGPAVQVVSCTDLAFVCPQVIRMPAGKVQLHFRPKKVLRDYMLTASQDGKIIGQKYYSVLRPAQMEDIEISADESQAEIRLEGESR